MRTRTVETFSSQVFVKRFRSSKHGWEQLSNSALLQVPAFIYLSGLK